jgi:MFS family permease
MIKNIKAITAASYMSMFFLGVSAAVVGAAAHNIGLSPYQIGLLIAAQNVGFTVSVLISGALSDQVEKTKILLVGSLILAVAFFTFFLYDPFWLNLGIMFFIGAGVGTYEGVTDALLIELHTRRQSLHINVNHFFVTFGAITIALYLSFLQVDWRNSVIESGLVVLVLAAIFGISKLPPSRVQVSESYLERLKILTRERIVVILFIAITLAVGVEGASMGIMSTFLTELRGFTEFAGNIGLIIFLIGMAAGRLLVGFFSKDKQVILYTLALFGASCLIFAALFLIDFGQLTYLAVFLAGLATSALVPLLITLAGLLYPEMAGTVLGAIKVAIPFGGILLPFLMSILARQVSLLAALLLFPLAFLLGFLILFFTIRKVKPVETTSVAEATS